MAIISAANVTSLIRSLIGESTAKYWTDDEISLYLKSAMITTLNKYWYLLAPSQAKVASTDLAANTAYVSQPDDCAKIIRVEVASNRKLLRKIEPDELWKYSEYDDGAASSGYLNIWYLEYFNLVTDFPEALRPLIAIEAATFALTKDQAMDSTFLHLRQHYEDIALMFLAADSVYEPTIFGDYAQERAYTDDNPVAWCFRDGYIYLYKVYDEE